MTMDITSLPNAGVTAPLVPVSSITAKAGSAESATGQAARDVRDSAQQSPTTEETKAPEKQLTTAADQLREYVQSMKRSLEFSVDQGSGEFVIKIMDAETKKVIRQIPPEELLRMARYIGEHQGSLIRTKA
jgi:flagellar protein FlaG